VDDRRNTPKSPKRGLEELSNEPFSIHLSFAATSYIYSFLPKYVIGRTNPREMGHNEVMTVLIYRFSLVTFVSHTKVTNLGEADLTTGGSKRSPCFGYAQHKLQPTRT
jgi:hypothetical protein